MCNNLNYSTYFQNEITRSNRIFLISNKEDRKISYLSKVDDHS